jgi:hypothetical protein
MTPDSPQERSVAQNSMFASILEATSKISAATAVLVYACGYLVTSLHYASYGVIQNNPFRPRIISAGAWFLLFALIPVVTVLAALGRASVSFGSLLRYLFPYWVGCCGLSILPAMLFTFSDSPTFVPDWWQLGALVIALVVFTGLDQIPPLRPVVVPTLSVILVILFFIWSVRSLGIQNAFGYPSITLWFFGVGIATMLELINIDSPRLWDTRWIKTFFLGLSILLIFAHVYYPNLRASWGGGAPVSVRIYFTKDSLIRPSASADALLIDEVDAGLYLKGRNDKKALFVPRSFVTLISFSDPNEKSELLTPVQTVPNLSNSPPPPRHPAALIQPEPLSKPHSVLNKTE